MPADRKAKWIERYGKSKAVKKWLAENPPPAEYAGSLEEYAYANMEEEPIDDPLEPDLNEIPPDPPAPPQPVTREEHDNLEQRVTRMAKSFNRALKSRRTGEEGTPTSSPTSAPGDPPAAPNPVAPVSTARRGGVEGLLDPLRRKRA